MGVEKKDSIVMYPCPAMGHIISMVELAKLLLHHYPNQFTIKILLITSDQLLGDYPAITTYLTNISKSYSSSISFLSLPSVSISATPPRSFPAMAFDCFRLTAPHVLQSLKQILTGTRIRALVLDLLCTSALPIGKQLGIPTYYFFTSGAACLGAFLCFPKIDEQFEQSSFQDLKSTLLDFPCMPPLKAIHMPEPMLVRDDPAYDYFVYFCSHLPKSDGIIVNSFENLEPRAVKAVAKGVCVNAPMTPTFYVGPLINSGEETDEHDCLYWLDKQPGNSVLFLCFGSRGSFSTDQIRELANGLERSGKRFLWVVKKPPQGDELLKKLQTDDLGDDFDLKDVLPEGFENRVGNRGMVVKSWVPQARVLNHDSVGGFVTHCGWNLVLESVAGGVPMVAWPLYAEQHLNRNVMVEEMKIAVPVEQRDEDGFVNGEELERRVRELMDSENGREVKERCLKMNEASMDAWVESGSSITALAKLVQTWKQS